MKKLTLDLDALRVESFATAGDDDGLEGTVYGHATWPVGGCTIVIEPGPPPYKKTHPPFCQPTQQYTCGNVFTCGATECEGTCLPGYTCYPPVCNNSRVVCPAPTYDFNCTTKTDID